MGAKDHSCSKIQIPDRATRKGASLHPREGSHLRPPSPPPSPHPRTHFLVWRYLAKLGGFRGRDKPGIRYALVMLPLFLDLCLCNTYIYIDV